METAFRISQDTLKRDQQDMIHALGDAGVSRNAIADGMCVSRNLLDQVMSDCNTTRLTTEHDLFLRSACAEIGRYDFIEKILPEGCYVSRLSHLPLNGSTDDELLDAVEILGKTRIDALRGNYPAIRLHGDQMKNVGERLVGEAMGKMGIAFVPQAQSAPLFDEVAA